MRWQVLIKEEVMEEIERVVQSGLALQTLLRFVLLVTRSEYTPSLNLALSCFLGGLPGPFLLQSC